MFKTIVWATDDSVNADQALPYARSPANQAAAKLVVVHVVERYAAHSASGLAVHADEELVEARLNRVVVGLSDEGLNASLKIVTHVGPLPAHEIARIARDEGADLIVVGTRGHSPVGGLLLGSVTMRLLRVASCPVLAVPTIQRPMPEDDKVEPERVTQQRS